jgi:glycosyltransferase involved in cell wall biosynthesis
LARSQATFKDVLLPAVFLQTQFERLDLTYAAQAAGIWIVRWINGDSIVEIDSAIDEVSRMHINRRLAAADALVAQSSYQQKLIKKNLSRPSTVIGSMIPDMPQAEPAYARFGNRRVLWVGRNHPTKNPEGLLALAELMPRVSFFLVAAPSDASPEYQRAIEKCARELSNVTYYPGLPLDATKRLYGNASLCVNTSHTEGMPNTLIEASVVGVPTGALYVNPEALLIEENGCFSARGDNEALTAWIYETLDDFDLFEKRCAKVQQLAQRYWDSQKVIDDYYHLFSRVFSKS